MMSSTIFVMGRFCFLTTRFLTPSMTKLELLFTNELNMLDISPPPPPKPPPRSSPIDAAEAELEIRARDFHRWR